jgi:hypothetical protein
MLLSCSMNNEAVNLSPVFNSIAALYKEEEKSYSSLLNYSSTMQAGFTEDERKQALLETNEQLCKVHKKLDGLELELKKSNNGKEIGQLMAQALNTSFNSESTQGFSEAKTLDFNQEIKDLNLYHTAEIFAGLLLCLDKLFSINISLKEMYPEAYSLKPKPVRDLEDNLDSLILKIHNIIKLITSKLELTAIDNMEEVLLDRPKLMNRKEIDSVGSVIRFLHSSKDSF